MQIKALRLRYGDFLTAFGEILISIQTEITAMMMRSFPTMRLAFTSANRLMVEAEQWPEVLQLLSSGGVQGTTSEQTCTVYLDSTLPPSAGQPGYSETFIWFQASDAEYAKRGQQLLDSVA
ncbi:hypothetical protein [Stenotrophomonas maltophilia]|uniref:hypothetical protein n=1 Tax=Stenotrophomonas maltophilia TaxID=40324 RepID=UPI00201CEFD0|nr:hypothetical protein [Stenotrophomonas maltophilia]UQY95357.1 hypothetical protein LZ605_19930 [Stenotrophomonas maltophilia]